jgi:hypothetical protein
MAVAAFCPTETNIQPGLSDCRKYPQWIARASSGRLLGLIVAVLRFIPVFFVFVIIIIIIVIVTTAAILITTTLTEIFVFIAVVIVVAVCWRIQFVDHSLNLKEEANALSWR